MRGSWALVQDYCWDSLASLYTCLRLSYGKQTFDNRGLPATNNLPAKDWLGITPHARDFPEFTQFSIYITIEGPKEFRAALYH